PRPRALRVPVRLVPDGIPALHGRSTRGGFTGNLPSRAEPHQRGTERAAPRAAAPTTAGPAGRRSADRRSPYRPIALSPDGLRPRVLEVQLARAIADGPAADLPVLEPDARHDLPVVAGAEDLVRRLEIGPGDGP